ncbi:hypothetical protein LAZ67_20001346 [Cordylochernes scorpioides]|uniref:Uncharacterized protein n=1 Tax=Cordylochernes scorpioides TaxID=51811 RepID=A0ABY6LJW8_9ARAC|nr:hypothetical protein LAZ67_20001346 [Cordylochernes scorpioides]
MNPGSWCYPDLMYPLPSRRCIAVPRDVTSASEKHWPKFVALTRKQRHLRLRSAPPVRPPAIGQSKFPPTNQRDQDPPLPPPLPPTPVRPPANQRDQEVLALGGRINFRFSNYGYVIRIHK